MGNYYKTGDSVVFIMLNIVTHRVSRSSSSFIISVLKPSSGKGIHLVEQHQRHLFMSIFILNNVAAFFPPLVL